MDEAKMELLPCPFCGSSDFSEVGEVIRCNGCLAQGPDSICNTPSDDWNRRFSHTAPQEK